MDTIVSLCKRRGFIFQSSEIYGGLGSTWDYGPLGVELKNNVKRAWWRAVVQKRDDMVGIDAAILMHPQVWVASGHVAGFADPFSACTACGRHYRADHVPDLVWESLWWKSLMKTMAGEKTSMELMQWAKNEGKRLAPNLALVQRPEVTLSWMVDLHTTFGGIEANFQNFLGMISAKPDGRPAMPCPTCGGELSEPEPANLMLETFFGPVRSTAEKIYMRPETAQGIFVNFENVQSTTRKKLPFGIAQIGKAFRNEITPGNFVFRTREFEQMEIEYFVKPGTDEEWHQRWLQDRFDWYKSLGMREENLRLRQHGPDELAHYAKDCYDVEYLFPMGWSELEGIANRSNFDLRQHTQYSGKDLSYFDDESNERYIPYVIEPSAGADRSTLAFLIDAYREEEVPSPGSSTDSGQRSGRVETRVVLKFHKDLAPIKVAVLPLSRNPQLVPAAREVHQVLREGTDWMTQYDDAQSIGRRYRRQDEIGTLYCVTVDFDTLNDRAVTIRDRDTMEQERVPIDELVAALTRRLG